MVMSIGPWPMSVLPCQVPASDFIRSNSGELGLGAGASAALSPRLEASTNTAQTDVSCFFMIFLRFSLLVICSTYTNTTNELGEAGQLS
jgi:hypothetical protein